MLPLVLGFLLLTPPAVAAASDYNITVLRPETLDVISGEEYKASTYLLGKSITAIFGPISEIRIELGGANRTAIDREIEEVKQKIRERIDRAKCLGRDAEVAWHKAPWVRGHMLLGNGRIIPIDILLSGIVVGDLLFAEPAEPTGGANAASQRRSP